MLAGEGSGALYPQSAIVGVMPAAEAVRAFVAALWR